MSRGCWFCYPPGGNGERPGAPEAKGCATPAGRKLQRFRAWLHAPGRAILFLFRQKWRTSINRFAEAMTIFAVMCAGCFRHPCGPAVVRLLAGALSEPDGHLAELHSPLLWDVFAVSTYFTVSLLFWYLGMVPDLATLRDRAAGGWRFSSTAS